MGVSKVDYNGDTLIDLSNDSVTPETLALGETAHNSNGDIITGTMVQSVGSDDDIYIIPKVFEENDNWSTDEWLRDLRDAYLAGKKIYARVNVSKKLGTDYEEFLVQMFAIRNGFSGNDEDTFCKYFEGYFVIRTYRICLLLNFTIDEESGTTSAYSQVSSIKLSSLTDDDVATAIDSTGVKIYKISNSYERGLYCPDFITTTDGVETYSGFYSAINKKINISNCQYVMLYIAYSTLAGNNHLYAFYSHKYKDTETNRSVYCFKSEGENETILFELRNDESLTYTTTSNYLTNEEINEIIGITVE